MENQAERMFRLDTSRWSEWSCTAKRTRKPFNEGLGKWSYAAPPVGRSGQLAPIATFLDWGLTRRGPLMEAATERTGGVVATCSYNLSMEAGVRGLKDNLSRYTRRIEAGAS